MRAIGWVLAALALAAVGIGLSWRQLTPAKLPVPIGPRTTPPGAAPISDVPAIATTDATEHRFTVRVLGRRGDRISPLEDATIEITVGDEETVEQHFVRPLPWETLTFRVHHPNYAPTPYRGFVFEGGSIEETVTLDALAEVSLRVERENGAPLIGWWATAIDSEGRAMRRSLADPGPVRFEGLLPFAVGAIAVEGGEVPFQIPIDPPLQAGEVRDMLFRAEPPATLAGFWSPSAEALRRDLYVLWTAGPPLAEVEGVKQFRATGATLHRVPSENGDAFRLGPFPEVDLGCYGVVLGAAWYADGRLEFSYSEPFVLDRPRVIDVGLLRRSSTQFQVLFAAPPYDPERADAPVDLSIRWPKSPEFADQVGLSVVVQLPLVRGAAATISGLPPDVRCVVESSLRGNAEFSTLTGKPFGPLEVTEVIPTWRRRR